VHVTAAGNTGSLREPTGILVKCRATDGACIALTTSGWSTRIGYRGPTITNQQWIARPGYEHYLPYSIRLTPAILRFLRP